MTDVTIRTYDARFVLPLDEDDAHSFAAACRAGYGAADLGEAFYAGYQAALRRLFPAVTPDARASLCATEEGGGHPKAMRCALTASGDAMRLDGRKTFVTGADRADELLVVAREGEREDGTPVLRIARISVHAAGVRMEPLPPPPFVPGIRHAVVTLDGVAVERSRVLEGDGYLRYLKPFRTVEDVHVVGAIASHLVARLAPIAAEHERVEAMLASIAALHGLAARDPAATSTHLALAGVLAQFRAALEGIDAALEALPDADVRAALRRDLAVLRVAEAARRARREAAWRGLEAS